MNVLVTGAQFKNKGAQSMLFTVISELRDRFSDVDIYYLPIDDCFSYPKDEYKFKLVFDDRMFLDYRRMTEQNIRLLYIHMQGRIQWVRLHREKSISLLSRVWKHIDVMIDVSGYTLTSEFNRTGTLRYLRHIQEAKKRKIPVLLMPQSFGPFDYGAAKPVICKKVHDTLLKVDMIFCREQEGEEALKTDAGITENIYPSTDLVLQSREAKWQHIFYREPEAHPPVLTTENNVGIVPNVQLIRHGDRSAILETYRLMINELVEGGKTVYIFRHSNDLPLCESIFEMFQRNEKVHIVRNELNCFEYSQFVRQFEFIIASRFHAIVHAYRECIPAFIFGWSIKYQALAKIMGQEQYVLDNANMTDEKSNLLVEGLRRIMVRYSDESKRIGEKLIAIEARTCFDQCADILERAVVK